MQHAGKYYFQNSICQPVVKAGNTQPSTCQLSPRRMHPHPATTTHLQRPVHRLLHAGNVQHPRVGLQAQRSAAHATQQGTRNTGISAVSCNGSQHQQQQSRCHTLAARTARPSIDQLRDAKSSI
jgi:hypothetical protein